MYFSKLFKNILLKLLYLAYLGYHLSLAIGAYYVTSFYNASAIVTIIILVTFFISTLTAISRKNKLTKYNYLMYLAFLCPISINSYLLFQAMKANLQSGLLLLPLSLANTPLSFVFSIFTNNAYIIISMMIFEAIFNNINFFTHTYIFLKRIDAK